MKNAPCCKSLRTWLKSNLGPRCLAPLTGQDSRALDVAVHAVELWTAGDTNARANAILIFGLAVRSMQESCWRLAFHAIGHMADWSNREEIWHKAGFEMSDFGRCSYEPGGDRLVASIPPMSPKQLVTKPNAIAQSPL